MKKLDWKTLNDRLCSYSEDELKELLEVEKEGARRYSHLKRLHQRYNIVRGARERAELLRCANWP